MKLLSTLILTFTLMVTTAFSQTNVEEVELLQSIYGMEKKDIVEGFINLDKTTSAEFWAVYDQYEIDRKVLGKKRLEILGDYATNYEKMSSEQMADFVKMSMAQEKSYSKLIGKNYKKIKSAVGTRQATQFFQLEHYLLSATRVELLEAIPFIGELDN